MRTQWRIGMCGPTGLDYQALFALIDFRGVSPDARPQLFDDLQVMEAAALTQMAVKYT